MLRQALAITGIGIRSLPARWAPSLVIVVGLAGVVAVFTALLAMSTGFVDTLKATGRSDAAIILRARAPVTQATTTNAAAYADVSSRIVLDVTPISIQQHSGCQGSSGCYADLQWAAKRPNLQWAAKRPMAGSAARSGQLWS